MVRSVSTQIRVERLKARRRRRTRRLRRGVVALALAAFVGPFATIYEQMADGRDPALEPSSRVSTALAPDARAGASAAASAGQAEAETEANAEAETEAEGETPATPQPAAATRAAAPAPTPAPVLTQQS
jgi:hypothetical protein